jgi:hypothetical protein
MFSPRNSALHAGLRQAGVLVAAACTLCGTAHAGSFTTANGVDVNWSLSALIGTNVRTSNPDPIYLSLGNGGRSGIGNDNGDLNFRKGQVFSTVPSVIGEIEFKRDTLGLFLRAKAWSDLTLESKKVEHGSYANGYVAGAKLSDAGFDSLSKFSNVALLDAYVQGTFDLGPALPLNIRFGNQVVNWGESLFVPGINSFGTFDITASHRPGAQVKEILKPIPQVFATLGLADGLSVEGFYQLQWKKSTLDGCGTYWSPSNLINCSSTGTLVGPAELSDLQQFGGVAGGPNFQMSFGPEQRPGNAGQFGLALRYNASAIDTEFGFFYTRSASHFPTLSVLLVPTTIPGSVWSQTVPGVTKAMQLLMDYTNDGKKIQTIGASFSTVVKGWSVFGEASHVSDMPVQINGVDLLNGVVGGIGPNAALAALPMGSLARGYDRKSRTQVQLSTLQVLPRIAGAESLTVLGEVVAQRWSGIGDPATSTRYGRAFVFGSGPVAGVPCAAINVNSSFCNNDGYNTATAYGLRFLAELNYANVFAGVNVKPRVYLSRDIHGNSADSQFIEGRGVIAPGVRFDYAGKYFADLSYSRFRREKYDQMSDRNFYSVVAGINF